ncbi:MAG: SRPBCC family protein [Vicinamibacteria bacterium]
MTSIGGDVWINAPRETVWRRLADLGGIHVFHPGLSGSHLLGDQPEGIGARRRCELKGGGHLDEEVVEWADQESLALTITGGKGLPPFVRAGGRFTLSDGENGGTVVGLALEYQLRFGWLGSLMDRLMVRREFERTVPAILKGLKRRAEADHTPAAA